MSTDDVASPCINICKMVSKSVSKEDEPTERCLGCDRTIDEITQWRLMNNDAKQAVIDAIILRKQEQRKQD